jgi:hypothetical protein
MKDELAHGTSWATLLCFSNFIMSMHDGFESSTCMRSRKSEVFSNAGSRDLDVQYNWKEQERPDGGWRQNSVLFYSYQK